MNSNNKNTQFASDFIYTLQNYPAKVVWSNSYWVEQNALFDSFYSFCQVGETTISLHGEMNIETFHKRRDKDANVAKLYKCTYKQTDRGLVETNKKYIGLGADPRMVSDGKNAYAYVVGYGEAKHPAFLYVEKDDTLHQIIGEEGFDWGKNWQPFLKNDQLFIVHELTPYSVYKINLKTFKLEPEHSNTTNFALPAHHTNHSMFRGGSNAIAENDFVTGIGRASAQPYKHLPFIWSSHNNASPVMQFVDFFNQISEKGFNIIDPTSFYKDGDNIYLGLTCSETCWFFEQRFLNILLVFDLNNKHENLPELGTFLSAFEDTYVNNLPNLKNHLFHCDRMQHDIPYSFEYGVQSCGDPGVLVYGPYTKIHDAMNLSVELSYLTINEAGHRAGIFDIYLTKEGNDGDVKFIRIRESELISTGKEIKKVALCFNTSAYIGYKAEFRVFVENGHKLNAFHIRTKEIDEACIESTPFELDNKHHSSGSIKNRVKSFTRNNNHLIIKILKKIWRLYKGLKLLKNIRSKIIFGFDKLSAFFIAGINSIKYTEEVQIKEPIRIDHLPWQLQKKFHQKYEVLYPGLMTDDRYGIREPQLPGVCFKYMPKDKNGLYQRVWTKEMIDEFKQLANDREDFSCEAYPSVVLQFYAALDKITVKDKNTIVIGSVSPWLECILLAYKAKKVVTIEYGEIPCNSEEITIIDRLKTPIPEKETCDIVCSFSSIEHNGLGRYGDTIDPDGDNKTMDEIYNMLVKGGIALIGIPVAVNNVLIGNGHRGYSKKHLEEQLFKNFKIIREFPYPHGAYSVNYTTDKLDWQNQPLFMLQKI